MYVIIMQLVTPYINESDSLPIFRQATNVQPSGVVITGTMDTSSGLRVQFYVRDPRGGVIPKQAVAAAIQVTLTIACLI